MTILEALVQLRNDLKLWVANNLRVKVDKEDGKGLSSCDFTAEEKEKLAGLSTDGLASTAYVDEGLSQKADNDHTHAISDVTNLQTTLNNKADKSTTLEGYGITDAYTKTAVDEIAENLQTNINNKAQVQIIIWGDDD